MYVDESGMNDNEFYPYAYSATGKRYYEAHPGHHSKRISMIGALCNRSFMSPFMFEGYCTTEVFEVYVEKVLLPNLKSNMVVIIDNASFHRSLKAKNLIEGVGARLMYLPPYSPDLNPIENYWYKIKTAVKKMMRKSKILLLNAMKSVLKKLSIC